MSEPIALIDMDGTVADFDGAMREKLAELANPDEDYESLRKEPFMKARRRLIKSQPGFWRNLPPLEQGLRLVQVMRDLGFRLVVLTKGPTKTTGAWTEKLEWVQERIPDASSCIVGGREDKGLVYGRVLFDDWPEYIESWLEWRPRGLVIMTDQPWNQEFNHPNVVRFNHPGVQGPYEWRGHLAEIEQRLRGARDR